MACRRPLGLSLWRPEQEWLRYEDGPALTRLPSSAWLVGLGNLGQAYLWTLGLLPYRRDTLDLVLHDFDKLATSNIGTSLLTTPGLIGQHKSRMMAGWAEARGFRTVLVERRFTSDFRVSAQEPSVALLGVDNASARQALRMWDSSASSMQAWQGAAGLSRHRLTHVSCRSPCAHYLAEHGGQRGGNLAASLSPVSAVPHVALYALQGAASAHRSSARLPRPS